MLKAVGIRNRAELIVFVALTCLVAVTPLGNEGTHPIVFGIHHSLLLILIAVTITRLPDEKYRLSPYFIVAVASFMLLGLVSVALAPSSRFVSFHSFYMTVLFLTALLTLARFQDWVSLSWKQSILTMVVGINLVFVGIAFFIGKRPLIGPFVNPNYFASFLLPGFAVCISYAGFGLVRRFRALALLAALVLFYAITQASSRGATLAAMGVLGIALFRIGRQHGVRTIRIVLAGAALAALMVVANPGLIQKFLDRGERDPYNYQRPQIWMGVLRMIGDHPIVGVGPGRYYYLSKIYMPATTGAIARYGRWPNIAHSEYLQYIADFGIPAAFLLFGIGGYLFRSAWKRAEHIPQELRFPQEAALLTAVGLAAHALVDNNWTVPVVAAGLAVISQGSFLPYGTLMRAQPLPAPSTVNRRIFAVIAFAAVFCHSTLIPALGLYFNEAGHRAYVADQFEDAELMHQMAVAIVPDHPVFLDNLGTVYFDEFSKTRNSEYLSQAESAFYASLAADPDFETPATHLEKALIQRLTGNRLTDQTIHSEIVEADRRVLRVAPFNPFIRKNLAEALYNTGSKADATNELLRAVAIEPNYVPGYLRLSEWFAEAGQNRESEQYRSTAIQLALKYQDRKSLDTYEALLLGRPVTDNPE